MYIAFDTSVLVGILVPNDHWHSNFSPSLVTWVYPDVPVLYPEIVALIRTSAGSLNFNDALIALACRQRGIHTIASFDKDFERIDWLRCLSSAIS